MQGEYLGCDICANNLIITAQGNVCLGILNGTEAGLGDDLNLIGDISFQDKLIIYDNVNKQIGW
ncbi:putative aspartic peptidase domain superfamily, Peptidase family A1 domain-containing protein [Helianthus annuus]|nr:putative aspartic peptidase domain superfamily, Peptidase family A1 domain-containing protein [Helianthus annuus]